MINWVLKKMSRLHILFFKEFGQHITEVKGDRTNEMNGQSLVPFIFLNMSANKIRQTPIKDLLYVVVIFIFKEEFGKGSDVGLWRFTTIDFIEYFSSATWYPTRERFG